jgi:predicted glycosyltransferase
MRFVITIQHPAHVHFFRYAIAELTKEGHEVRVFVRDKGVAVELLEAFEIPYTVLCESASSVPGLLKIQLKYEAKLFRQVRTFEPDVLAAIGGVAVAHVSSLTGAKSVVFTDTEHATLSNRLAFPFADTLCAPTAYLEELSRETVRYQGLHELAYLHPNRFKPNPDPLVQAGIDTDEKLVTVRLSAWQAMHDIGERGITELMSIIEQIETVGATPILTIEGSVPEELEVYTVSLDPVDMHQLLYFSDLYVGEGATMAAESAVLGTPGIYTTSLEMGYLAELSDSYGLIRQTDDLDTIIEYVADFLKFDESELERRREELLSDKIDTTSAILEQLIKNAE